MVQTDKRVLWHPQHDNKFVVGGGSQITLYEWAAEYPEIRHVTSQHDLVHMKCFAWSPDPSFDDLVAVGHSTGRIDLLRLEASRHAHRTNFLSAGPVVALQVRNSRSCNSLAFCSADPNYLASGLDKVRGDCSLMIWDVSTASAILTLAPHGRVHPTAAAATTTTTTATTTTVPPKLSLSSVTPHQQQQQRQPARRPQPQIPQADVGPRVDPRVLQQHAPTENVSAVSFLPHSTHLLLAGISYRWLRLFDLRSPVPSTTNVASKVQGIATDPFDAHRIATFGDAVVTVWDERKLQVPVLSFTEKDALADGAVVRPGSGLVHVEFSSTRRGMLASLERDASYVRFWDLMGSQPYTTVDEGAGAQPSYGTTKPNHLSKFGRRPWANLPWPSNNSTSSQQTPSSPKEPDYQASLLLSDTRRTKKFSRPLASFALVPSKRKHPLTTNVMVVNKEGDLELYAVHDTPKQAVWSSRGDLSISAGQSCRIVKGYQDAVSPFSDYDSALNYNPLQMDLLPRQGGKPGAVIPPPPTALSATASPALFGRGDEDGFPALGSAPMSRSQSKWKLDPRGGVKTAESGVATPVRSRSRARRRGEQGLPSGTASRVHSATRARKAAWAISHVVEGDVSMIMRRRALQGYGLSKPETNVAITQDDLDIAQGPMQMLPDLWAWVYHTRDFLSQPTPILHGYDFSYQGLLGIWEGFQPIPSTSASSPAYPHDPSPTGPYYAFPAFPAHDRHPSHRARASPIDELHGNFHAALNALIARRKPDRPWKSGISTAKGLQRQIALQLCGWPYREEEWVATLTSWEMEGHYSRAACWLVFTKQYSRAIELLMRSGDEAHTMMSGTIAALVPLGSGSKNLELREHCERLIYKLQDPYFRALLTYLALNDWTEVLLEDSLPFRERLAIALQFLDDKAVTSYLHRCMESAVHTGDIDGLIIPGLASKTGLDILQAYVDKTGDVQTAAILGSYVCPPGRRGRIPSRTRRGKVRRWVESYRDLLDGFKMFHHRVSFDIEIGQVALGHEVDFAAADEEEDWVPKQILLRCNYCNKTVSGGHSPFEIGGLQQKGRPTACPHCNRALPRCSICLMTLSIVQDAARDAELMHAQAKDTMDDAIVMCQTCRHGGHAAHILDWFYKEDGSARHDVCAVADCNCRCAEEM